MYHVDEAIYKALKVLPQRLSLRKNGYRAASQLTSPSARVPDPSMKLSFSRAADRPVTARASSVGLPKHSIDSAHQNQSGLGQQN